MQRLVMDFLARDLEEFAETHLKKSTLSYVPSDTMRVRIEALQTEMYTIASSLRASAEGDEEDLAALGREEQ